MESLSILYWRCPKAVFAFALALVLPFNTLLEMQEFKYMRKVALESQPFFQYSIGDARATLRS